MRGNYWALGLLALVVSFTSCSKKNDPEPEVKDTWDKSGEAYLKDSTLYYTKLLSLWQEHIVPRNVNDILDSVKVRNITNSYKTAEDVLDYLTSLTPKDANTGNPIDRYSFLDREGSVSDEIQNAVSTSYGMSVFYLQTQEAYNDNDNAYLYVRMVDVNSPAYVAGIRRGDRIMSINGNTKLDYNTQKAQNFKGINDALSSKDMLVKWRTPASIDSEKSITSSLYSFNPVLSNKVIEVGANKVGYLAFSSFVNIYNNGKTSGMYDIFQNIFSGFESAGVNTLVIDLRYNGGGAVNTAEYLADKIAPSSATGKRMYSYKLNPVVQDQLGDEFLPVDFSKKGALNISKVYFLVTKSTASASELLINSLKPYMDVQVIGSEKTYGKPVGFWGIPIGKKSAEAEIYVASFQMYNADGYGDYYSGLELNKTTREDYLKDFGDPQEGFLAEALYHIEKGTYSTTTRSAIASKDKMRVESYKNIKTVNTRPSDLGMFKFGKDKIQLK